MTAVAALLFGCNTPPPELPPGNPKVTAAPRAPSPKDTVKDARSLSQEADRRNEAARSELDTAANRVTDFREGDYRQLQALVTRLRDKASATGEELHELYERVFSADARIQTLLDRLQVIRAELDAERDLRQKADEKLVAAQGEIAAKDAEAEQLRQQFTDMRATAKDFEDNARKNHDAALASNAAAAKEKGKKELLMKVLIATAITLLISLIVNFLQFRRGIL